MVAISRRSTLIAASISLALVSISPIVDAAAIATRSPSSPHKPVHHHHPMKLPLPADKKPTDKKKPTSKKMEKKHKHKPRELGPESSPPASRFFKQAYFSVQRRDNDEVVVNGNNEHLHIHDKDGEYEKVVINGKNDHVHVHGDEKIVVNGDHDKVHVHRGPRRRSPFNFRRTPHHHDDHWDHDREKVVVNGNNDDVHVDRRDLALSVSNDGTRLGPRAPHDHDHDHDHDWHHDDGEVIVNGDHDDVHVDRRGLAPSVSNDGTLLMIPRALHDRWDHHHDDEKVIVNGDHDKVHIHRREGTMGVVSLMAGDVKIGEMTVRNDSTIGAASQGDLCQLAAVDPDTLSGQQTSDNSTIVRITFPTDEPSTDEQAETCATFNPDPSANATMSVQPCGATENSSISQLFQLFSDGTLRPAGSAANSTSTNSSTSGLDQRDTNPANPTPVALLFESREAMIQQPEQVDDTSADASSSTLLTTTTSTVTETATVTVTTASTATTSAVSSSMDASLLVETLNVAIVGNTPDPTSPTVPSPTLNVQAMASSIANTSSMAPAVPTTASAAPGTTSS